MPLSKKELEKKQRKWNQILKMRKEGYSLRVIARMFEMTPEGISWVCKRKKYQPVEK